MSGEFDARFDEAKKLFENENYDTALNQFSDLALDLILSKGLDAIDEIENAMRMAIASYEKINNSAVTSIIKHSEKNTFEQFFCVVRHYMDYKTETELEKVWKVISQEIPLSIPEERILVFNEDGLTSEDTQVGPYKLSIITAQGPREMMEDEHLAMELLFDHKNFKPGNVYVFGVFDGHGGNNCAKYVKEILPEFLLEELKQIKEPSDLEIYNALRKMFIRLNSSWASLPIQETEHADYSGTTATLALIIEKDLWVANVGDSRTVLARDGLPIQLSEDAKPTVEKYFREIYLRGGEIKYGRIIGYRGTLNLARSIGDIDQPSISALPDIRKFNLSILKNTNNQLILACDGLWDVVSPEVAADVCKKAKNTSEAAQYLKQIAFLRGTTDNVTIMIVDLT